jgi:hypothetical protein
MTRSERFLLTFLFAVVLALLSQVYTFHIVMSHEAMPTEGQPFGWVYPTNCCHSNDCARALKNEVKEQGGGYLITPSGTIVRYGDMRIRESPDGEFHICRVDGIPTGYLRCLFVPPPAT